MEKHSFRNLGQIARSYAQTLPFQKNFHTRKLGEITVFFAVIILDLALTFSHAIPTNFIVRLIFLYCFMVSLKSISRS